MKKLVLVLVMVLGCSSVFAMGDFGLNSDNGQCILGTEYDYETKALCAIQYLEANYPELSTEAMDNIVDTMCESDYIEEEFYKIIDLLVMFTA